MDLGLKPRPGLLTTMWSSCLLVFLWFYFVVSFPAWILSLFSAIFKLSASKSKVCLLLSVCLPTLVRRPHLTPLAYVASLVC